MNVYTLTAGSSVESALSPQEFQKHFENSFRKALKGSPLVNEFSRVSEPHEETGRMSVVCSGKVADFLCAQDNLGIKSFVLDKERTERARKIMMKSCVPANSWKAP